MHEHQETLPEPDGLAPTALFLSFQNLDLRCGQFVHILEAWSKAAEDGHCGRGKGGAESNVVY